MTKRQGAVEDVFDGFDIKVGQVGGNPSVERANGFVEFVGGEGISNGSGGDGEVVEGDAVGEAKGRIGNRSGRKREVGQVAEEQFNGDAVFVECGVHGFNHGVANNNIFGEIAAGDPEAEDIRSEGESSVGRFLALLSSRCCCYGTSYDLIWRHDVACGLAHLFPFLEKTEPFVRTLFHKTITSPLLCKQDLTPPLAQRFVLTWVTRYSTKHYEVPGHSTK